MSAVASNYEMKIYLPVLDELRVVYGDHERVLVDCIDRFTSILVVGLMLLLAHDMFLDNATHAKMFTSHAVYDNIFAKEILITSRLIENRRKKCRLLRLKKYDNYR